MVSPVLALVLASAPACGTGPDVSRDLRALHRFWSGRGLFAAQASAPGGETDFGNVAILEDRGDLIARRNPFDLDASALRFEPNPAGGYDLVRLELPNEAAGSALALEDDGFASVHLPFAFRFFERSYSSVFVHADGSVSFGAPDPSPGDRGLARLLSGPPRVAAFMANLDPARGGGIAASLLADRAVFAWDRVPGAFQTNQNSFSLTLHASGAIDVVFARIETREATVGVSPGATSAFAPADLSSAEPRGTAGALAERFSESERLDLVASVRRFLRTHADHFEQIVVYTTRPLNPQPGSLAFEVNVRNEVQGIGLPIVDEASDWGSAGGLASVAFMDAIDPYLEVDGFEILGHEVGHRWLARLRVPAAGAASSAALLGRGDVHWSFFLDSDASVLEGNDIADLGGGRFETVDIVRGFSALDLYAMGLMNAAEVPPFFYVADADGFQPNRAFKTSSGPEVGVRFTGVRRDVTIGDVVAALGPRVPDAAQAPRLLRQAFLLVADAEAPATAERVAAVERIRARFERWYRDATRSRGSVDSSLP